MHVVTGMPTVGTEAPLQGVPGTSRAPLRVALSWSSSVSAQGFAIETGSFQQQQPGGNAPPLGVSTCNLGPMVPSRQTWRMSLHD